MVMASAHLGGGSVQAIVQDRYGGVEVLRLTDTPSPHPGTGEVLVQVRAASMHADVWHAMTGHPYLVRVMGSGVLRPKQPILGTDLAGRVDAVGAGVTRWKVGDDVFGETRQGNQWRNAGAFAEFAVAREAALERIPSGVSYEQAAAVPTSALIALDNVGGADVVRGRLLRGRRVLVNGAAGGVGVFVVQLAKAAGADVVGVDAGDKLDLLTSLGVDEVIDYTHQDFTDTAERYDLVVDIPGNRSLDEVRSIVAPGGRYVFIGHDGYGTTRGKWVGSMGRFARMLAQSMRHPEFRQTIASADDTRLFLIAELMATGQLTAPVDAIFPLGEAADALRHLMAGRARGKVIIRI
jgi:NADPH:quinone reductase-like Zn-dependent oxidoreductase